VGKSGVVKSARVGGLNTVVTSYALPASLLAATAARLHSRPMATPGRAGSRDDADRSAVVMAQVAGGLALFVIGLILSMQRFG
jgi:hypothetical protein